MNREAVTSCPLCLRQYEVDDSTAGKVGRCYGCRSQFVIIMTKLTPPVNDPVDLHIPVEPHTSFLKNGCITLTKNACLLLSMAGEPVTDSGVMMIIKSVPRDPDQLLNEGWQRGYYYMAMKEAYCRFRNPSPESEYREGHEYFSTYIPSRSHHALDMLTNATLGVLGGIDWDRIEGIKQPAERRRGPLERWAERRGL